MNCTCNTRAPNRSRCTHRCCGGTNRPSGAEWLFNGTGIGASNQFEAGGFIRTRPEFEWPNIQYHFLPVSD